MTPMADLTITGNTGGSYDGNSRTAAELAASLSGVEVSGTALKLSRISFRNTGTNVIINDQGQEKQAIGNINVTESVEALVVNSSNAGVFSTSVSVASGVYVFSTDPSVPALDLQVAATVTNSGYIVGGGGRGGDALYPIENGYTGGPAISVSAAGVSVTNNSGAYIAGGGGGGGGGNGGSSAGGSGAGGGAGGGRGGYGAHRSTSYYYGFGAGATTAGGTGSRGSSTLGGYGGGSGGGSGGCYNTGSSNFGGHAGGGGGIVIPGTGGAGGPSGGRSAGAAGGSSNNVGASGPGAQAGGGGGGWSAAGGRGRQNTVLSSYGGSGGVAVTASQSYSLSNSGTIWGAT